MRKGTRAGGGGCREGCRFRGGEGCREGGERGATDDVDICVAEAVDVDHGEGDNEEQEGAIKGREREATAQDIDTTKARSVMKRRTRSAKTGPVVGAGMGGRGDAEQAAYVAHRFRDRKIVPDHAIADRGLRGQSHCPCHGSAAGIEVFLAAHSVGPQGTVEPAVGFAFLLLSGLVGGAASGSTLGFDLRCCCSAFPLNGEDLRRNSGNTIACQFAINRTSLASTPLVGCFHFGFSGWLPAAFSPPVQKSRSRRSLCD